MSAAKTKDFCVRSALVRKLLAGGVARRDIRHEITLDTSSSGGRADLVILSDAAISGIEIKSGSDTLDRVLEQMHSYGHAFDSAMVVADERHMEAMQQGELRSIGYRARFYRPTTDTFVSCYGAVDPSVLHPNGFGGCRSYETSTVAMAHLLWQAEASAARGMAKATRSSCMRWMHENMALKDCRTAVIAALRARVLNAWEISFWTKFDAQERAAA